MKLDDLKKTWKQQRTDPEMDYSRQELLMLINNKMIAFEKDIKGRDRREFIACAIVIIAFAGYFFITPSILSKIGSVIIILSAIFIWYRLKSSEQAKIEQVASYDHSVNQHLKQELKNVQTQKKLLVNVAWWYITPMCAGLMFVTFGADWDLAAKLIYMIIVLLVGIGIWFMNQKTVKQRYEPLIKEIEKSLRFIEINDEQEI